jgi:protein tyrosine phosphatase (PTP) superfamily phosphohydrolase (DUF442 family)
MLAPIAFLLLQAAAPATAVQTFEPSTIRNFVRVTSDVCTGGQPRPEHFARLRADGVRAVLNLRTPAEHRADEEREAAMAAGLTYFNIPVAYSTPTDAQADEFLKITDDPANRPIFIHCTAAIRVGAFWLIRRVVRDNWTWERALEEAKTVGLVNAPHLEAFVRSYIASRPSAGAGRQVPN